MQPEDVFFILLILGGDVVERALAQLAGGRLAAPSFSFGWVAYSINAVMSAVGENKLMPAPDYACIAINGKSGHSRSNSSRILGRLVRNFEIWMDRQVEHRVKDMTNEKCNQSQVEAQEMGDRKPEKPKQVGLCGSIYKPTPHLKPAEPKYDAVNLCGFAVAVLQLGIAAIPCGVFVEWGVLMITACGVGLSFLTASLPQWRHEKWACRRLARDNDKRVVLTRGSGSQHALVVLGGRGFLDLEDLAGVQTNVRYLPTTRRTTFRTRLHRQWAASGRPWLIHDGTARAQRARTDEVRRILATVAVTELTRRGQPLRMNAQAMGPDPPTQSLFPTTRVWRGQQQSQRSRTWADTQTRRHFA